MANPAFSTGVPRNGERSLSPHAHHAHGPRTHLVGCSDDISHAQLLHKPATTYSESAESLRGRDYTEITVPGAYIGQDFDREDVDLILDSPTEQVFVVTHSNSCGTVNAFQQLIANPDETPERFGRTIRGVVRDLAFLDVPADAIRSWDHREIAKQIAVVTATNVSRALSRRRDELVTDSLLDPDERDAKIARIESLHIAGFVSHEPGRKLEYAMDRAHVLDVAKFAEQARRSAKSNLGLR
jgi:hypothetical protein